MGDPAIGKDQVLSLLLSYNKSEGRFDVCTPEIKYPALNRTAPMHDSIAFTLTFKCNDRTQLEHVISYLAYKYDRLNYWLENYERDVSLPVLFKDLADRVGVEPSELLTKGFVFVDDIAVGQDGAASITTVEFEATKLGDDLSSEVDAGEAEANFGADVRSLFKEGNSELLALVRRFRFLEISGQYTTACGESGTLTLSGSGQ